MCWNQEPSCENAEPFAAGLPKTFPRWQLPNSLENGLQLAHEPARRRYRRFPIFMRADYIVDGFKRPTTIANISRGGVFINAEEKLSEGRPVRLTIDWPAALDGRCPLSLVVFGRVVRRQKKGAAICIERYEFRLRPRSRAAR